MVQGLTLSVTPFNLKPLGLLKSCPVPQRKVRDALQGRGMTYNTHLFLCFIFQIKVKESW